MQVFVQHLAIAEGDLSHTQEYKPRFRDEPITNLFSTSFEEEARWPKAPCRLAAVNLLSDFGGASLIERSSRFADNPRSRLARRGSELQAGVGRHVG